FEPLLNPTHPSKQTTHFANVAALELVVSRVFRTFSLAERHPALAHAVMAPLICWSLSSSMLRYLFVDHAVPAMWRSLAAASAFVLVLFPVSEHPPRSDAAVLLGDVLLFFFAWLQGSREW